MAWVAVMPSGYRNPPNGRLRGKPYRVYKGGRHEGKGAARRAATARRAAQRDSSGGAAAAAGRSSSPESRWTWKRWTRVTLLVDRVLLVIWSLAGYFSVRERRVGREQAARRPGTTAASRSRTASSSRSRTNILLLGTDHSTNGQAGRSTTSTPTR